MLEAGDVDVRLMNLVGDVPVDTDFVQDSDAVVFGSPAYVATMCWQLKKWLDTDRSIKLAGKLGAAFATENFVLRRRRHRRIGNFTPPARQGDAGLLVRRGMRRARSSTSDRCVFQRSWTTIKISTRFSASVLLKRRSRPIWEVILNGKNAPTRSGRFYVEMTGRRPYFC